MNASQQPVQDIPTPPRRRSTRWLYLGTAVCVATWLALGTGIAVDVDRTTLIVLTTAAALATEGMIWLTALVLGINVYTARRHLWQKLRERMPQARKP